MVVEQDTRLRILGDVETDSAARAAQFIADLL
jgi:hypothetical protein